MRALCQTPLSSRETLTAATQVDGEIVWSELSREPVQRLPRRADTSIQEEIAMRPEWSTPAAGQSNQIHTAARESLRPVELSLATGAGARIGAAVAGAVMVGGGAWILIATTPWRPREMVTLGSAMAGPLLVLIVWAGAMFLAMAMARPGRLRLDHDRLSIVYPALLSRTLVVPRRMIVTITIDPVANREPRRRRAGRWSATRSKSALLRDAQAEGSGAPWWPVDLVPYLPLLAAGPAGSAGAPNAVVVLSGPLSVPTRASTWALSRTLAKVMERPPPPGKTARGFLLRLADPAAAASALAGEVALGPLETRQVTPLAPQRAGLRPRALALGVAAAVVLGAVAGHGYWQSLGQSRLADQSCRALEALLRERPGPASAPSPTTGGALASSLPAGTFPVLGFEQSATGEGRLDVSGAASLQPESAAVSESLEVHGFLRGHGREWQRPDGGRVQALVYEFGS
ncbi:MAG TPA: hypothetical protein VML96_03390, partial [Egibacteraceae bacterium]|nr:hypothetical protein [Egibacteraceae bacterium]